MSITWSRFLVSASTSKIWGILKLELGNCVIRLAVANLLKLSPCFRILVQISKRWYDPRLIITMIRRRHRNAIKVNLFAFMLAYNRTNKTVAFPSLWVAGPLAASEHEVEARRQGQHLKTFLFALYWCIQRIKGFFTIMRYINFTLTFTLTLNSWHFIKATVANCKQNEVLSVIAYIHCWHKSKYVQLNIGWGKRSLRVRCTSN